MILEEKLFSHYTLLNDQISLSDCLYILGIICILIASHVMTSLFLKLTFNFSSTPFCKSPNVSGQKSKYLKREKKFEDEVKNIFYHS